MPGAQLLSPFPRQRQEAQQPVLQGALPGLGARALSLSARVQVPLQDKQLAQGGLC